MSIFDFDDIFKPYPTRTGKPFNTITSNRHILNEVGNKVATYFELDMMHGPWLAGGSLRKLCINQSINYSDWDIFFKDDKQFKNAVFKVKNDPSSVLIYESKNALTYTFEPYNDSVNYYPLHVQLINRKFYQSVEDLLNDFDFTICQYASDGLTIQLGKTSYIDEKHKILNSNIQCFDRPGFVKRLIKYIVYGYTPTPELLKMIENNKQSIDFKTVIDDYDF